MKELTILMPCLNEVKTIGTCIMRAQKLLKDNNIEGEILISDNGSTDGSLELAGSLGARTIECRVRGYGAALQYGIEHAFGEYILMGDGDDSYHFDEAMPMINRLREGYEVCMGTRLKGRIMPAAMPFLNRYLGNPLLTMVGKVLFGIGLSDFHCGMRAFKRTSILDLGLVTLGMEWASEMIIKAELSGLKMTEVPITLYRDGRGRPPHLRPWRDGWRHLRFMLLHSPKWLFIIPGLIFMFFGALGEGILMQGMVRIGGATLDVHSLLVMSFMVLLGGQMLFAGIFAKLYTYIAGILPYDEKFDRTIRRLTLEKLLIVSLIMGLTGLGVLTHVIWKWYEAGFPALNYQVTMRRVIPALTLIAISVQGIVNGFMLSVLFLKTRVRDKTLCKGIENSPYENT